MFECCGPPHDDSPRTGDRRKGRAPARPCSTQGPCAVMFLDVDGVLNSFQSRIPDQRPGWDHPPPEILDRLEALVKAAQAVVVLSSTWRLEAVKLAEITKILNSRQIVVHGTTSDFSDGRGDRVDEILAWLQECPDKNVAWIAIDDINLMAMNDRLGENHFVRTCDTEGLTQENCDEALHKLSAHIAHIKAA